MNYPRQLLVIAHGHPRWSIGGGENAAYAIHQVFSTRPGWRSCFLAAAPTGLDQTCRRLPLCWPVEDDREWLMLRSGDWLLPRRSMSFAQRQWLEAWCKKLQPDVVHVHHLIGVGIDVLLALRRWLPNSRIIFTLHEFLLLCPYRGQLLRRDGQLCGQFTLENCARCLPEISSPRLWMREQWMRTLSLAVDHWIAPSQALLKRFVDQGFPADRFSVIENLLPVTLERSGDMLPVRQRPDLRIFGYFGALSSSKGVDIVLEAFAMALRRRSGLKLQLHCPWPPDPQGTSDPLDCDFCARVVRLAKQIGDALEICGPYAQSQVCERMVDVAWVVMASRWLENSPVVIQEARLSGRPMLVPALGGMAEKVMNGVQGIHYPPGDVSALADLMVELSCGVQVFDVERVRDTLNVARELSIAEHESLYLRA